MLRRFEVKKDSSSQGTQEEIRSGRKQNQALQRIFRYKENQKAWSSITVQNQALQRIFRYKENQKAWSSITVQNQALQRKFKLKENKQPGSITVFLALVLAVVLSLCFSLLEAGRVQGLAILAQRSLQLSLQSTFGMYHIPLWQNYHLLFLDGNGSQGQFSLSGLEGIMVEEDGRKQRGASFYHLALKGIEISSYALVTDEKGKLFRAQACKAAREQLAEAAADSLKGQMEQGKELAEDREELQKKWEQAGEAEEQAKDWKAQEEEAGDKNTGSAAGQPDGGQEEGEKGTDTNGKEPGSAQSGQELPENPIELVKMWKSSPILAMVVENPSELSGKAISLQDTLGSRRIESGNLAAPTKEKLEKIWLLQYLDYYFSCQNGEGEGGCKTHALDYELEYCIGGKATDKENLERTVKELLLLREAGNFATIMQDSQKQSLALEMAAAVAGFTGIAPLVHAVQVGILLAWSYVESILDVRCLLSGGKVPLVKKVSEWKSDISSGQKTLEQKPSGQEHEAGLDYREYLQVLLLTVNETALTSRAMDIIERNIRMVPGEGQFCMDHMIGGVDAEALYGAHTLFLGFATGAKGGMYHFSSRKQLFY